MPEVNRPITRRQWFRETALSLAAASLAGGGCGVSEGRLLPNESTGPLPDDGYRLLARFAHICDAQIIDEESPARLTFAKTLIPSSWRAYERYSPHLLDGIIRAINRHHEFRDPLDFVIHAGDAVDNRQLNELQWFLDVFDGNPIKPTSGPDDRAADRRGPSHLDPHAFFEPQGLYRQGIHGDKPSIPWFALVGNHDVFAQGIFPIVASPLGGTYAPLPLQNRLGLFLPTFLGPTSSLTYSPISPARPGLPQAPAFPTQIIPNPERRYFSQKEFTSAHFGTVTGPAGHGFMHRDSARAWYSVSPVPGLRLVALDSCCPVATFPAGIYWEGSISSEQIAFLDSELQAAQSRGELVLVLTHHPSSSLRWSYGSAVTADEFRALLNRHECVVAHLVGHNHRHRVSSHGGYVEFETASILDYPQEGRFVEIWRSADDVQLRYRVFSHLPSPEDFALAGQSAWGHDPLLEMRRIAFELAARDPVVPGLASAEQLLEEGIAPITDAISGITEEITTFGEQVATFTDKFADSATDAATQLLRKEAAARVRKAQAGALHDRAGVIVLGVRQ